MRALLSAEFTVTGEPRRALATSASVAAARPTKAHSGNHASSAPERGSSRGS